MGFDFNLIHLHIRSGIMMIKDFIKEVKKTFGDDVEFKATSKEGKIYRSKGYDKIQSDIDRGVGTRQESRLVS